jgi:hypothetical protein
MIWLLIGFVMMTWDGDEKPGAAGQRGDGRF